MAKKPPPSYCDDWGCKAMWSCARAWCRSREYWTFDVEVPVQFKKGPRKAGFSDCYEYERDEPREWLKGVFECQTPMEPPQRGFVLYGIKGGRC